MSTWGSAWVFVQLHNKGLGFGFRVWGVSEKGQSASKEGL